MLHLPEIQASDATNLRMQASLSNDLSSTTPQRIVTSPRWRLSISITTPYRNGVVVERGALAKPIATVRHEVAPNC